MVTTDFRLNTDALAQNASNVIYDVSYVPALSFHGSFLPYN